MKKISVSAVILLLIASVIFFQCNMQGGKVTLDVHAKPFEKLSDYHFFKGKMSDLLPNDRVLPYDLISALFSDYAHKARFVWMPEGTSAKYSKDETLEFPVGTVLIKNFYYPHDFRDESKGRKIMETRLLVRRADKWDALTYVWNDEQSEAVLEIAGDSKKAQWTDLHGTHREIDYSVPNKNQCKNCHSFSNELVPIGPKVRYLNCDFPYAEGKKNQLDKWAEVGYLKGYNKSGNTQNKITKWDDPHDGTLEERAKSYLEVNCAHCHRREGNANTSGLYLLMSDINPESWGIMKSPVAAGAGSGDKLYDIVPGKPGESILVYRIESDNPEIRMPELGRSMAHAEAVVLIKEWIAAMK